MFSARYVFPPRFCEAIAVITPMYQPPAFQHCIANSSARSSFASSSSCTTNPKASPCCDCCPDLYVYRCVTMPGSSTRRGSPGFAGLSMKRYAVISDEEGVNADGDRTNSGGSHSRNARHIAPRACLCVTPMMA